MFPLGVRTEDPESEWERKVREWLGLYIPRDEVDPWVSTNSISPPRSLDSEEGVVPRKGGPGPVTTTGTWNLMDVRDIEVPEGVPPPLVSPHW